MSVVTSGEIGFGKSTHAVFLTDDGGIISSPSTKSIVDFSGSEWALWGDNNDTPILIADDIANTPVLSAGIEAEARFATGKGPEPYLLVDKDKDGNEVLEWVDDEEIADWLELNQHFAYSYSNIYNMIGYRWGATQFILNKKKDKINRMSATDVYGGRLEKKDNKGRIKNLYLCADWKNAPSKFDTSKMSRIQLLTEGYELQELQTGIAGVEFAMLHRLVNNGAQYYPAPMHRAASAWVKIARSIPNIKKAMNLNQMSIKYVIIFSENYWKRTTEDWDTIGDEKRKAIIDEKYDEVNNWLTGELNAGKTIMAGRYFDNIAEEYVDDISITVVDDKLKDGKMLPDGAAADKQILFSMGFNPAIWGGNLLGDGASGGAGSGSDIREATLVLLSLLHPERQKNLASFNLVKNFNGWAKRLEKERDSFSTDASLTNKSKPSSKKIKPRLVWRYTSSILTTLDTGKQSKQTNS